MGFGKFLKVALTQTVKCDYCGRVIADGHYYGPRGEGYSLNAYNAQLSVFEIIKYSAKKHTFCSKMCEMNYKLAHNMNEYIEQEMDSGNPPNVNGAAMFCSNCGNALKQGARFCTRCGTKVI